MQSHLIPTNDDSEYVFSGGGGLVVIKVVVRRRGEVFKYWDGSNELAFG